MDYEKQHCLFCVSGVAIMLAAPAGAFITGQNLVVDGGTTIGDGN